MCCKRLAPMRFLPRSYFCTLPREPEGVAELLSAHSEHYPAHPDTAAHVSVDGAGGPFAHCLFQDSVVLAARIAPWALEIS
jgi:hypothetical protein